MVEEAEALLHTSLPLNRALKTLLTLFILFSVHCIQFGCLDVVLGTVSSAQFFFGILFDYLSQVFFGICLALYTDLPSEAVQILCSAPFLLMVFFSTTFSPGKRFVTLPLGGLAVMFSSHSATSSIVYSYNQAQG